MVSTIIGENLLYPLISASVADIFHTVSMAVRLALLVVLILVVIWGIRRQGAEGWLVLPAVVLLIVSLFTTELLLLHIRINWFPFGMTIQPHPGGERAADRGAVCAAAAPARCSRCANSACWPWT